MFQYFFPENFIYKFILKYPNNSTTRVFALIVHTWFSVLERERIRDERKYGTKGARKTGGNDAFQ